MKKMLNAVTIEGYLYECGLEKKQVSNQTSKNFGTDFISGTLDIATDENATNIVTVHYTYVTAQTSTGKKNITYSVLERIMNENKSWTAVGKGAAMKVKLTPSLDVNDFYNQNDELVSARRNEGGFATIVNTINPDPEKRTQFRADMLITRVVEVEADEEKNIKRHVTVGGAVFNFRNELLPMEFVVYNEGGMKYFLDLGVDNSNPVFTNVWGILNCMSESVDLKQESAFGEECVHTVERRIREYVITGSAKEPYEFGEEGQLTPKEVTEASQNREVKLADIKKRQDEYNATKNARPFDPAPASPADVVKAIPKGTFNF